MTTEQINKVSSEMKEYFQSIGLDSHVSQSRTSFGNSNYVYVKYPDGFERKIRISDHSCSNSGRIMDEIHYHGNEQEIKDMVEYYQFPERFMLAEYVSLSDIYIATVSADKISTWSNVISTTTFVSNKGNEMVYAKVYKTRSNIVRM